MKLEIKTFTSYFCACRYTFYETWFNKSVAIVREEKSDGEWTVKNSISVPKDIFGLLKSKSVPPNIVSSLGNVGLAEENFPVRTNVDRFELPVSVREVLFRFDCEDIPLSDNQLGYMSDLETLEWYWEIVSNPQSPRLKEVTPPSPFSTPPYQDSTEDSTEFNHLETPVKSRPCYSPECPPAPKKGEIRIPSHIFIRSKDSRSFQTLNYFLFDRNRHDCFQHFPIFNEKIFSLHFF